MKTSSQDRRTGERPAKDNSKPARVAVARAVPAGADVQEGDPMRKRVYALVSLVATLTAICYGLGCNILDPETIKRSRRTT